MPVEFVGQCFCFDSWLESVLASLSVGSWRCFAYKNFVLQVQVHVLLVGKQPSHMLVVEEDCHLVTTPKVHPRCGCGASVQGISRALPIDTDCAFSGTASKDMCICVAHKPGFTRTP